MTPNPSLVALLDSAIAKLAAGLMSDEAGQPQTIDSKVAQLCAAFRKASNIKRNESFDILTQIIKSIEPNSSLPIMQTLSEVAPNLVVKLQQDRMIADRIKHIYRVAEIAQILSTESLQSIRGGIRAVQKRIFEVTAK